MAHVLVVDDLEFIQIHMVGALRAGGHEVWTASDGIEACKILRSWPATVVVVDLFMPDMDGIELVRRLQRGVPELPVIGITGATDPRLVACLDSMRVFGARMTLRKPLDVAELVATVGRVLSDGFPTAGHC